MLLPILSLLLSREFPTVPDPRLATSSRHSLLNSHAFSRSGRIVGSGSSAAGECTSSPAAPGQPKAWMKLTPEQLAILEGHFSRNSRPSTDEKNRIGHELGRSELTVEAWFVHLCPLLSSLGLRKTVGSSNVREVRELASLSCPVTARGTIPLPGCATRRRTGSPRSSSAF